MPATYFTLDEIASKTKSSPPKLENAIENITKKWILLQVQHHLIQQDLELMQTSMKLKNFFNYPINPKQT